MEECTMDKILALKQEKKSDYSIFCELNTQAVNPYPFTVSETLKLSPEKDKLIRAIRECEEEIRPSFFEKCAEFTTDEEFVYSLDVADFILLNQSGVHYISNEATLAVRDRIDTFF